MYFTRVIAGAHFCFNLLLFWIDWFDKIKIEQQLKLLIMFCNPLVKTCINECTCEFDVSLPFVAFHSIFLSMMIHWGTFKCNWIFLITNDRTTEKQYFVHYFEIFTFLHQLENWLLFYICLFSEKFLLIIMLFPLSRNIKFKTLSPRKLCFIHKQRVKVPILSNILRRTVKSFVSLKNLLSCLSYNFCDSKHIESFLNSGWAEKHLNLLKSSSNT